MIAPMGKPDPTVTWREHVCITSFCRGHDILTRGNIIICIAVVNIR